jgi:N-acetylglucosaminyldiphosphoundecaprenol N-acetyl-beta-D-mannosaminyltransferase
VADAVDLLGIPVHVLDRARMIDRVSELVSGGGGTVAYLNVHVSNTAWRDPALTRFLRSVDVCYCDGAGIKLGARMLGDHLPERMTGADWIWDLAARAEAERWRIGWIGGHPGVAADACETLKERHPGLRTYAAHGFYDDDQVPGVLERMNAFGPHILFVGMGTPVQEAWVERWRGHIDAPVIWCLGATADFVSGRTTRGPQWLHDNAEWAARLITEPRRLWKRYLLGNPVFLARVVKGRLTSRR